MPDSDPDEEGRPKRRRVEESKMASGALASSVAEAAASVLSSPLQQSSQNVWGPGLDLNNLQSILQRESAAALLLNAARERADLERARGALARGELLARLTGSNPHAQQANLTRVLEALLTQRSSRLDASALALALTSGVVNRQPMTQPAPPPAFRAPSLAPASFLSPVADPSALHRALLLSAASQSSRVVRSSSLQPPRTFSLHVEKASSSSSSSSLPALQQQQQGQHRSPPLFTSPAGRRCVPVALQSDRDTLAEYQCVLRQQIIFFAADQTDIEATAQGRNKPIVDGQVGIACRHCVGLVPGYRPRGAVYFPARLSGIYQAAQNMAINHFHESCRGIPDNVRARLVTLKEKKSFVLGGGKQYWANAAQVMGVAEGENGLEFAKTAAAGAAVSGVDDKVSAV